MRIISHRGNINGPTKCENTKNQVLLALEYGYDVEVDVSLHDTDTFCGLYLGHDFPQEYIEPIFLKHERIWVHCKSLRTFHYLRYHGLNTFYHDKDLMCLTQNGHVWHHEDAKHVELESFASSLSVACCLRFEKSYAERFRNLYGICTDYPEIYREYYQNTKK